MPSKTLSVVIPDRVLTNIRKRARQAKRTVEAEIVSLLTEAVNGANGPMHKNPGRVRKTKPTKTNAIAEVEETLPPDIEAAIAEVEQLDDIGKLREAVVPLMKPKQAKRLEALNRKAQDEGLTDAEERERDELLHLYDKSMVVRATALAELHKRGVDVNELIAS
jgi:hypothetical protein